MTEPEIDALAEQAGNTAAAAMGRLSAGQSPFLQHIVTMAGASALIGLAAQQLVKSEFGYHPETTDERVVRLIRGWGDALQHYPNGQAVAEAMTKVRDELMQEARHGNS